MKSQYKTDLEEKELDEMTNQLKVVWLVVVHTLAVAFVITKLIEIYG